MGQIIPPQADGYWEGIQAKLDEQRRDGRYSLVGLDSELEIERRLQRSIDFRVKKSPWALLVQFVDEELILNQRFDMDIEAEEELARAARLGLDVLGLRAAILTLAEQRPRSGAWKRPFDLARHALEQVISESGDIDLEEAKRSDPSRFLAAIALLIEWYEEINPDDPEPEFWDWWWSFRAAWDKVEFVAMDHPMDGAFLRADRFPLRLKYATGPGRESCERLAGAAYHLQKRNGEETIQLPVKLIGAHLFPHQRNPHVAAGRVLQALEKSGLLECVEADYSFAKGRAREYRFQFDRIDLYELFTSLSKTTSPPQNIKVL